MVELLSAFAHTVRHELRLVELPQVGERLDEVGRDREHARLFDAIALQVLPDEREILLRGRQVAASSSPMPRALRASRTSQCSPVRCARAIASTAQRRVSSGGRARSDECPAAVVARPDEQLAVALPLVEQPRRLLPAAGPQRQLAQVWGA